MNNPPRHCDETVLNTLSRYKLALSDLDILSPETSFYMYDWYFAILSSLFIVKCLKLLYNKFSKNKC